MIGNIITSLRMLRLWWIWLTQPTGDFALDDEIYARDTAALKSYDARARLRRHPSPRDCPTFDCRVCLELHGVRPDPLLTVTSLDPVLVGRQAIEGDALLDVAAWLAANGWTGREGMSEDHPEDCAGRLQRYAAWLLKARAVYEKGQVTAS